jgi:SAM-dependent methyltransferase
MNIPGWLRPPELGVLPDMDSPDMSALHGRIIRGKRFCRETYLSFYRDFQRVAAPFGPGALLVELGSGGGFIKEVMPAVVTSEVVPVPGVDRAFSALDMPFQDGTVDAFFMKDVLHHLSDARRFFRELDRCLKPGGRVLMVEPANTLWGRFILKNFHHEMFDVSAGWGVGEGGRLSLGNGAIPWIIFHRDRALFEEEFPSLRLRRFEAHTPVRYLLSGGLSLRQLLPDFLYKPVRWLEAALSPLNPWIGMFLTVELEKSS